MQQLLEEGGVQHLMVYGDGELAPNQTSIYFSCNNHRWGQSGDKESEWWAVRVWSDVLAWHSIITASTACMFHGSKAFVFGYVDGSRIIVQLWRDTDLISVQNKFEYHYHTIWSYILWINDNNANLHYLRLSLLVWNIRHRVMVKSERWR